MGLKARRRAPLAAFSHDGASLSVSHEDGRVKIWDVASGQMRTEVLESKNLDASAGDKEGHVFTQYTAMAWARGLALPSGAGTPKTKKKRSQGFLLLMGTASGDVLCLDASLGQVRWRVNACHTGEVVSVALDSDAKHVVSSSRDGQIALLEASSGTVVEKFRGCKKSLHAMALSPDGGTFAIASSAGLRLMDSISHKRTHKFSGHATPVTSLAFSTRGDYLISAAEGERHVAVWDVSSGSGGGGEGGAGDSEDARAATALLAMEAPPSSVASTRRGTEEIVVAVGETGDAYLWRAQSVAALGASSPVRIRVAEEGAGVFQAKLPPPTAAGAGPARTSAEEEEAVVLLQVVRGSPARPVFERVAVGGAEEEAQQAQQGPGGGAVIVIGGVGEESHRGALLAQEQNAFTGEAQNAAAATSVPGSVRVLGSESLPPQALVVAQEAAGKDREEEKKKKKRQRSASLAAEDEAALVGTGAAAGDVMMKTGEEEEEDGVGGDGGGMETLEQRIQALGLVVGGSAQREGEGEGADGEEEEHKAGLVKGSNNNKLGRGMLKGPLLPRGSAPMADSLQVLLSQALQANDRVLIDRCLQIKDEKVLSNTVRRLRPATASLLLRACVARLQSRPSRAAEVVPWLRAALTGHASWLMSAAPAQPALCTLHQLIDARISVLRPLLALQGRLDLIMAQMSLAASSSSEDIVAGPAPAEAVVYEEEEEGHESDEDEDVEDVAGGDGGSEGGEWETDDENDDDVDEESLDALEEDDDL